MSELKGIDYIKRPYLALLSDPDFSKHAYRVMETILGMTSKEIENIDLLRGK